MQVCRSRCLTQKYNIRMPVSLPQLQLECDYIQQNIILSNSLLEYRTIKHQDITHVGLSYAA
jgi:hypothetical protein